MNAHVHMQHVKAYLPYQQYKMTYKIIWCELGRCPILQHDSPKKGMKQSILIRKKLLGLKIQISNEIESR